MDEHKILHINNISMLFTYIKITTISFFLLTSTLPQFHCQPPPQPSDYSTCKGQPGDLFRFNCHRDQDTTILIGTQNFTVLDINTKDYTIKMKRTDLNHDVCSPQFDDIDLSPTLSRYDQSVGNITIFYNCSSKDLPYLFNCGPPHSNAVCYAGADDKLFDENPGLKSCKRHIHVPVGLPLGPYDYYPYGRGELEGILNEGFEVKYTANEECVSCLGSAERCWSDYIDRHVQSCCHEGSNATFCHKRKQLNRQKKIILGSAGAAFVGLLICITIFYFKYKSSAWHAKFWLPAKSNQDIEAFLRNHGPFALRRYKFSDIKKMTSNFKVKLGQGGYGVVYMWSLSFYLFKS